MAIPCGTHAGSPCGLIKRAAWSEKRKRAVVGEALKAAGAKVSFLLSGRDLWRLLGGRMEQDSQERPPRKASDAAGKCKAYAEICKK
ncbi:hypothetical protein WJX72_006006 [[Myrmecia] bisecta]|uniref:Uncharacterized protein n=1 Tax=[Myrmecia] bisecta TaxID=41462 RepID=A0AAW1QFT3_9CHLO